jgi:sugar lactone lactonase YvrE
MNIKTTILSALPALPALPALCARPALCALLALAPAARATLYYHIDGESGSDIVSNDTAYTATGTITIAGYTQNYTIPHYTLTQANNANCVEQNTVGKFGFVVNPDGDYAPPAVVSAPLAVVSAPPAVSPFKGSGYLQFSYPAFRHPDGSGRSSPPGNKNAQNLSLDAADKLMVAFAPHYNPPPGNPNHNPDWNPASIQRRDIERYIGFALYIPTVETMPVENTRWTILYQAFQLGTGARPPFAITITRARTEQPTPQQPTTVEISFGLRDNDDTDTPEGTKQQTSNDDLQSTTHFRTTTLKRGTWYSLVIWQKPSSDPATGKAKVWLAEGTLPPSTHPTLNKHLVLDYEGKWGYPNPQKPGATADPDRDLFSGQLGLYSNDTPAKPARVLFDEIKYADTYDEANPATLPPTRKPTIDAFDGGVPGNPTLITPGQTITITGSNLTTDTEVWLGDTQLTAGTITINTPQTITATVPPTIAFTGYLTLYGGGWKTTAGTPYRLANAPEELLLLNDTQTITTGHTLNLTAASASDLPIEYTWQYTTDDGATWLNAIGSNYATTDDGRILTITAAATQNNYRYRYMARNAAGAAYSNNIKLIVAPAILNEPAAIASAPDGALYIADTAAHTIQKITPTAGDHATAALLAGAATPAPAAAGAATPAPAAAPAPAPAGAPAAAGYIDATGTRARFNTPTALALDATGATLLVADTGNHAIRKITLATNDVTTLASAATGAPLVSPAALALDAAGTACVTDSDRHTLDTVAPTGATVHQAGTPGTPGDTAAPGVAARFNAPAGIAIDDTGQIYIADTGNHTIRTQNRTGDWLHYAGAPTITGTADGAHAAARFDTPRGMTSDEAGNLYIADTGNHAIRVLTTEGEVLTLAGTPGVPGLRDGKGTATLFDTPRDITLAPDGALYIADTGNALVRKITFPAANFADARVSTLHLTPAPPRRPARRWRHNR